MTKEVQNALNYYFCDVCHYCFEAESLPDRCPDCGKTVYQNRPAIRQATEKEVQDLRKRSIITHQGQKKKHLGQEVQKIR